MEAGTQQHPTSRPKTREELQEQINNLERENRELIDGNRERVQDTVDLRQKLSVATGEIGNLKEDLYRLTIENARLEGYRDRVHEFDPVTERQEYSDRRREPMRGGDAFTRHSIGDALASLGHERRPLPWYRRG